MIEKYGKVIISEEGLMIAGFKWSTDKVIHQELDTDFGYHRDFKLEVLAWAKEQLNAPKDPNPIIINNVFVGNLHKEKPVITGTIAKVSPDDWYKE